MKTPKLWFTWWYANTWWIFGIHIWKQFYIPIVIDEWGFYEDRILIFAIDLFGFEFYIDYIRDYERIIEVE